MGRPLIEKPMQVSNVVSVKVSSLCIVWGGEREVGGFLGRITLLEGERSGEGGGSFVTKQSVKGRLWKIDRQ